MRKRGIESFKPQERTPEGWLKHIVKEGARYHVTWWNTSGAHCTEPDCENNHRGEVKNGLAGRVE